jgi:uncharacterized protein
MSRRESYSPGEFCWVDLAVPDPQAVAPYYKELMGWNWEQGDPQFGGYGMFTLDGKTVAGLGPTMADDQPPAWSSYISVEDADDTARAIREAGGTVVMDPMDVADAGRMAVCQDPQGAFFGLWQPGLTYGAQQVNEIGNWTWNQLATTDVEAAERFYNAVFGWSLATPELAPEEAAYFNWKVEGQRWDEGIGGAMPIEGNLPDGTPPVWIVHLSVPSAEGAMETTKEAGGRVLTDVIEIPVGRLAAVMDPQGAFFSIIEPNYPEPR